jgi:hypothetical protein
MAYLALLAAVDGHPQLLEFALQLEALAGMRPKRELCTT